MFNKILLHQLKCNILLALFKQRLEHLWKTNKSRFPESIWINLKSRRNEDTHLVSILLQTSFCLAQWNNTWPAKSVVRPKTIPIKTDFLWNKVLFSSWYALLYEKRWQNCWRSRCTLTYPMASVAISRDIHTECSKQFKWKL